jgi:hypothetical protein
LLALFHPYKIRVSKEQGCWLLFVMRFGADLFMDARHANCDSGSNRHDAGRGAFHFVNSFVTGCVVVSKPTFDLLTNP